MSSPLNAIKEPLKLSLVLNGENVEIAAAQDSSPLMAVN